MKDVSSKRLMGCLSAVLFLHVGCIDYHVPDKAAPGCEALSCAQYASCDDSSGAANCICDPGFEGDGLTCVDLDECAGEGDGHTCHENAFCTNTTGSYSCACKGGYMGEGFGCEPENFSSLCWEDTDYQYQSFGEWHDAMDALVTQHPEITVHQLGITAERSFPIEAYQWGDADNLPVVVLGGLLGSEFRAIDQSVGVITQLISDHPDLLETYTFHFIPLLNPDGYDHGWSTGHGNWNKNRMMVGDGCRGINLNRNFDYEWESLQRADTDPCDWYYRGESPFEAEETAALRIYAMKLRPIHSLIVIGDGARGTACYDAIPTLLATIVPGVLEAHDLAVLGTTVSSVPAVGGVWDSFMPPISGSALGWFVEGAEVPGEHAIAFYLSSAVSPVKYRDLLAFYMVEWLGLL